MLEIERYRLIKVLQVITELELGGAQLITLNFLQKLDSSKFRNYLISSPTGLLVDKAKNIKNIEIFLTSFLKRSINPIFDLLAFLFIYKYIKKNKIDIVHTHSSKAGILGRWAAKMAKVELIVHTYHGFGFNNQQKWITRKFFIWIEKLTSLITDKLVFVSKKNLEKADNLGIGNKNILIYGGIEKRRFNVKKDSSKGVRRIFNFNKEEKLVGTIGPLKPQKSPFDFVKISYEVLNQFPKAKFLWVGEGYLRPKVEYMIRDLNLEEKLYLLGWREDVPRVINILDIVILTSYWEGLPHSLLEAMISGKPIVAYGVDGVWDILEDGINGYIVEPGNIEKFSNKIIYLLNNENLRKKMGNTNYEKMENKFNVNDTVERTQQLYLESCCKEY